MRSLTVKLVAAFLAVSLVGTLLLALVTGRMTASEFAGYVVSQEQADLAQLLADYYRDRRSWEGVEALLQGAAMGNQAGRGPGAGMGAGAGGQGRGPRRGQTAIADASGVVVVAGMGYRVGDQAPPGILSGGAPIIVDGERVGTVVQRRGGQVVTAAGATFLRRINSSLIVTAAAVTLMALLLGVLLARTLTRPLHELTAASHAMAQGELGRIVPVHSQDELGVLATAFNQMSVDLAQAQERRRQMAADIAHDLRTPISLIQGHAEALRDGVLPASDENFRLIHDEALRLNRMVEDLRTLSQAESGELSLIRRMVQVGPWLQDLVKLQKPRAEQRNLTLKTEVSSDGWVNMDADRMAQVVYNLIDNALRHTPQGGQVVIGARQRQGTMEIFVQDSGPGIAPEDLPHIFERFYRVDKARQRHEGGSGLGLAIAHSIVALHGGKIWAESEVGNGATFVAALDIASA